MSEVSTAASSLGEAAALPGGHSVGLDVGGTKVLGVLLGPDGAIEGSVKLPTVRGPQGVVSSAAQAVRSLTDAAGLAPAALAGLGLGVPGLVDPQSGSVMHAVNLGIEGEPFGLARELSALFGGIPVDVDNDLNVAALGASHAMGPEGQDLAFLALGTGLAAGIVLGGELRRGVSGAAGEIGHIPINPEGPLCACGQRGCVETYASGTALSARWPSRFGRPAPAELFEAAAAGDSEALRIRDEFAAAVASAIRILELTVDVRHVVLGGGVTGLGQPLLDVVRSALVAQSSTSPFLSSLELEKRVSLAPSDVPVAAVGAAIAGRRKVS
ncbi:MULTISPECIES: ROK family protein [Oerskovia]|uniref:ROK family protein n=1 Tax=Oerskovia TaxID=162491 RepID=UPI00296AF9D1|nr:MULTISPECIES: ROK family protein [Oerskovia]